MLDNNTMEECRKRNGGQKADRPSRIDDVMQQDRLGQQHGDAPIVDGYESYDEYPTRHDLSDPSTYEFLCELFSHPLVQDWSDVMDEISSKSGFERRKSKQIITTAVDLYNLDVEERFKDGETSDKTRLELILDQEPHEAMISPSNPMLVGEMYGLGMSVQEITDVLSDYVDFVDEETIRNTLKQSALLKGKPSNADTRKSVPLAEKDTRLGGSTVSLDDGGSKSGGNDIIVR